MEVNCDTRQSTAESICCQFTFFLAASVLVAIACPSRAEACLGTAQKLAIADLDRLSNHDKFYAMYLWLGDEPVAQRATFIKTLAGHCHGLSRNPTLLGGTKLNPTGFPQLVATDLSMVRVSTEWYSWDLRVVRRLVEADPFRPENPLAVEIPWIGGKWFDGVDYPVGNFAVTKVVPIVSARWFIWQTLQQQNRDPGYYDFLDLKSRDDIDALAGFSRAVQDKTFQSDWVEATRFSGVSIQPRNIITQPVIGGVRYGTEDSAQGIAAKNVLRIVDRQFAKHDAEEWFFFLPNRFWGLFLCDFKGVRQNFAPIEVVGANSQAHGNDKAIHVGWACLQCHYRKGMNGSAGLIDFEQHFRTQLSVLKELTPDYDRLLEFQRLYLRPFHQEMDISRLLHDQAVFQATGLRADQWALNLTTSFEQYDAGVTVEEAALYLGCDTKILTGPQIRQALLEYAVETGKRPDYNGLDQVLAIFALGQRMPRVQYHEAYPVLRDTLRRVIYAKTIVDVPKLLVPGGDAGAAIQLKLRGSVVQFSELPNSKLRPGGAAGDRAVHDPALLGGLPAGSKLHPSWHKSITGAADHVKLSAAGVKLPTGNDPRQPIPTRQVGADRSSPGKDSTRGAVGPRAVAAAGATAPSHPTAELCFVPQRPGSQSTVSDVRSGWATLTVDTGDGWKDRRQNFKGSQRPGEDAITAKPRIDLCRTQDDHARARQSATTTGATTTTTTGPTSTTATPTTTTTCQGNQPQRWWTIGLATLVAIVVCTVAVVRDPTRYRF